LADKPTMVLTDDPPLYRDLMRLKPDALTPNSWAVKAGVSRTVWSDMRRHGNPSRRTLEKLLAAAGSSLAEFEALRIGDHTRSVPDGDSLGDAPAGFWRAAPLPPLPLYATAMGAEWQDSDPQIEVTGIDMAGVVGRLPRPASLSADRDAYALTTVGDSMWPRYRPGRSLLVSPITPIGIGDDVLVWLAQEPCNGFAPVLIKELVRRTPAFVELRQFNPDVTFRIDSASFGAIHKILGESI
jgi:hypothetical protein